ncbi:twin-arginine translocase TatA/TatE family subunit [Candidatus Magnetominusculus dajiuhuensis]|uniref:twin-arginine translocase TatA/TatE family subunit n=1 Tax=Candidatus Magnetominusculus dajiuhuensis TaxID=3137712 RepID=UPI003B43241F
MFEGMFQPMHLFVIAMIVLILFGPSKLPQLGEGIGKGIRGFKKALSDDDTESAAKPAGKSEIKQ